MPDAYICDAVRTPIGRYGGALAQVRADDLAAVPISALIERNTGVNWVCVDDVVYGCANQAGEDNRNVARMAGLLAGLPADVPGVTLNRLCASGLDAVATAARVIRVGEASLMIAGGVESMTRAPFVTGKAGSAFSRVAEMFDTTIGWRFVNPKMKAQYGIDSMPQTAENVAQDWHISRADQDAFAARSQARWSAAQDANAFAAELVPVTIPRHKDAPIVVSMDEHPRPGATADKLGGLKGINGAEMTITAGNASGVNDGAAALLLASGEATKAHGLKPMARVVAAAAAGVEPRIMGIGPVPAVNKALKIAGLTMDDMDLIELNEAFASQSLAVLRDLGVADDDARVNPKGGAIALGHPLGASGARMAATAAHHLRCTGERYALCTMCVGVGQGFALILEGV
ncbi:MAG: 3-oxoadipyl-CoA thiolase [Rhodobacteraceae bacterium]|nr:3-oxoadipyl-CoA thiolase [Paracoccaceae bacterium]